MSSQERFAAGENGEPSNSGEAPFCSQCQSRMTVKQISPVLFASDVDDMVYGCEGCGTEVKRTVKRA
jgi:DNA-directed RNA polymerase subunit RPC12/RpoP